MESMSNGNRWCRGMPIAIGIPPLGGTVGSRSSRSGHDGIVSTPKRPSNMGAEQHRAMGRREAIQRSMYLAVVTLVGALACGAGANEAVSAGDERVPQVTMWTEPRPITRTDTPANTQSAGPAATSIYISANEDPEGDMPRRVAYTPDGLEVVIVHRDTDNVTFFDVNTQMPTHTVPVGDFPMDVAVTPDGRYVIVPNAFDDSVSIIDGRTHTLAATVPITGSQPYRVAITPDSGYAVVGIINDAVASSFSVIDLEARAEVLTFPSAAQGVIAYGGTPMAGIFYYVLTHFALTPDGSKIVQPDRWSSRVMVYDRATGDELASLPTAPYPTRIDISADGTTGVVSHGFDANTITKIHLVDLSVSGSYLTPYSLSIEAFIRITPDNSHAIAATSGHLIFVDLATGATTADIVTGSVGGIELSFDGRYAFIPGYTDRVIDIDSQNVVGTVTFATCRAAATSPTELRAVALNNLFREDIHFYGIDGASSFLEGRALSGEPEEADATRDVAISADGTIAVATNYTSNNATLFDLTTQTVRSYVEVGQRPLDVAITPDGTYAVVCASGANNVVIIHLSTDIVVATLPIISFPGRVRISPDGQFAYVLNLGGTDRVTFIQLQGVFSPVIVGQVSAGETGIATGYAYMEMSGIELSQDGSVLAVCDSFNDLLRLYDTAARTQLASVTVGDFPIRVAFSPDGTRAYVANSFSDDVSVIEVDGANSSLVATVPNIELPLTVDVDTQGQFVYVGNTDWNNPGIHILRSITNSQVGFVPLLDPARDSHYSAEDSTLYIATTGGELVRINAAGASSSVIDATALASRPSDLAFSDQAKRAVAAQPVPDGIDMVSFGGPACPADLSGDGVVDGDDLEIVVDTFGQSGPGASGADVNGDGVVNVLDLIELLLAFGNACP